MENVGGGGGIKNRHCRPRSEFKPKKQQLMLLITLRLYAVHFFYGSRRITLMKNVRNICDRLHIGLNSVQYMNF